MVDDLTDIEMDRDRQVFVGPDGDLSLVSGIANVEQSLAISAGDVLRPLIGEPIQDSTFADTEATLTEILQDDPQLESVNRVSIDRVNTTTGVVYVEIFVEYNNSFTAEVSP